MFVVAMRFPAAVRHGSASQMRWLFSNVPAVTFVPLVAQPDPGACMVLFSKMKLPPEVAAGHPALALPQSSTFPELPGFQNTLLKMMVVLPEAGANQTLTPV